jgi:DNA processing protein
VDEKRALAGLWSVPGIGAKTVATVRERFKLAELADCLIEEWVDAVELPTYAAERIPRSMSLGELGDELFARAQQHKMQLAWRGERSYPERLAVITDAPPVLFHWGRGNMAPPRRRVAMVGTRHPSSMGLSELQELVREVAETGIGVVSGAAMGIDMLAHRAAAAVKGETWAFVGSALDQLDPPQARLWAQLEPKGATFWTELPPGVRAQPATFPRRNRLISGCSDAVVVLRAGRGSGSRFTVEYATDQNRPVLAAPGPPKYHDTEYCHDLIHAGVATLCRHVGDVMAAVGVSGYESHRPPPIEKPRVDPATLSAEAQAALAAIDRSGRCFDELLLALGMKSGKLIAALFELTMSGLIVEHAGRRYEKV